MVKGEPPSASRSNSSLFLIGKNSRGDWVVRDQRGLRGGLFVDRAEALKFAMAFLGLASVGAAGLVLVWLLMPETRETKRAPKLLAPQRN